MAETKIEWADYTFNPWRGCTKVNEGCRYCYAEVNYSIKMHGVRWGPGGTRAKTSEKYWNEPIRWDEKVRQGVPELMGVARPRVFCASLADVFEDWQGPILDHKGTILAHAAGGGYAPVDCESMESASQVTMDDLRADLFRLIDATPNLDWLLLTKRPENIHRMWPIAGNGKDPGVEDYARRENVWLGTSVSDQETADRAIPELLRCRHVSPVLFLSAEPLLGPLDFRNLTVGDCPKFSCLDGSSSLPGYSFGKQPTLDWVIFGGESGPNARPCDIQWIRDGVAQCRAAGVPAFVKQLGSMAFDEWAKRLNLTDPKGGDWSEWPRDLQVRELPTTNK